LPDESVVAVLPSLNVTTTPETAEPETEPEMV
jgi:hypothetical protein